MKCNISNYLFLFLANLPLKADTVALTRRSLSPYYELSFQIRPFGVVRGWSNIIHVTTGGNNEKYGDRTPAVFFHSETTKLRVCSAISGNKNHCWTSSSLPMHKFTSIRIMQRAVNGKLLYKIFVNGTENYSTENNRAEHFGKVDIYSSDKWNPAAKVYLRNLKLVDYMKKSKVSLLLLLHMLTFNTLKCFQATSNVDLLFTGSGSH